MSASNSASDSKGTILIFDLKVHILLIGYDVTIKYGLHLELSSQKNGPRIAGIWTTASDFKPNALPLSLLSLCGKFHTHLQLVWVRKSIGTEKLISA